MPNNPFSLLLPLPPRHAPFVELPTFVDCPICRGPGKMAVCCGRDRRLNVYRIDFNLIETSKWHSGDILLRATFGHKMNCHYKMSLFRFGTRLWWCECCWCMFNLISWSSIAMQTAPTTQKKAKHIFSRFQSKCLHKLNVIWETQTIQIAKNVD